MATTNGSFSQQDQYQNAPEQYPASTAPAAENSASGSDGLSKEEVGWYFVEQYYTTLSRTPEKLHVSGSDTSNTAYTYLRDHSSSTTSDHSSFLASRLRSLNLSSADLYVYRCWRDVVLY